MTQTTPATPEEITGREEDTPIIEEGFTPISHVTVMKKNRRYVGVLSKNIREGEIVEKCGFAPTPYKTKEPDERARMLAGFLPVMPCSCESCKVMGPTIIIPTGNMIFFQFSTKPNLEIQFDGENGIMTLRSTQRMRKGDELFIDYTSLYPENPMDQESMFESPNGMNDEMAEQIMKQNGLL